MKSKRRELAGRMYSESVVKARSFAVYLQTSSDLCIGQSNFWSAIRTQSLDKQILRFNDDDHVKY